MKIELEHLIVAYLEGTITQQDIDVLMSWLEENPENKKMFFELKQTYENIQFDTEHFDTIKNWESLIKKKAFPAQHFLYIPKWKMVTSYAAISFLIILSSALYFYPENIYNEPNISFCVGKNLEADSIKLPDGTSVILLPGTKLQVNKDYGRKKRIVYLEGEAFFNVAKLPDNPFIVKANGQEVEALGTQFNVMAFPQDSIFVTTLLEGSVRASTGIEGDDIILKPNEQLTYNRTGKSVKVKEVEAYQFISWTKGTYYFPEQSLKSITDRLEKLYGVEITINSEEISSTSFSGTFKREQSIYEIMDIVSYAIPIHYTINNGKIIINKKNELI